MSRFLWTQKLDFEPNPRTGHAMAFDLAREKVVLFGGDSLNNKLFNDTWEWDGEFWTQIADMGPGPRSDHAMAFDANKGVMIVFGGVSADKKTLGDTWTWDGEAWTQLSNSGPEPRSGHALVFNKARNTILLFGGESAGLTVLGDTWEFDGEDWTQLDETGPSPRKFHSMAYDTARNRAVLFGGMTNASALGDTWEWNDTSWIQTADFGPDKCLASSMVFTNSRATLYGGISSINPAPAPAPIIFNNSWDWDGKHWTQRQDIGPGARWGHAMCFDNVRSCIVLFGGLPVFGTADTPQRLLGDTWEHLDTSTPIVPPPPPPPPPAGITIVSVKLSPNSVPLSQVPTVVATVTLSGIVTNAAITIPAFTIPKRIADIQPLPPGTQPTALPSILIPVGASFGQIQLGTANITETAVVIVPQLNDPNTLLTDILTITDG